MWTHLVARVEASGVSCDVTLHTLALDLEDGETGQYGMGFTDSTVKMVISPDGVDLKDVSVGKHGQLHAKGFCIDLVAAGDRVTDSFSNIWRVTTAHHAPVGDVVTHYELDLELMLTGTGSNLHPPPTPVLPPTYSGILTLNLGYFASPSISEEGNVYGENARELIQEEGNVYGEDASNVISEVGTAEALTPTISYVGATNATANNSLGDNWTLPGGWAAGDLAIFWWYTYANTKTVTEPATVTQLQDAATANYGRIFIGYRILEVGDAAFAWTSSNVASSDVIWGVSVFRDANAAPIGNELTPAVFTDFSGRTDLFPLTISTDMSGMFMFYGKRNDYTSIAAPVGTTLCGSGSSTAGSDASAGASYILALRNTPYVFSGFTLGGGSTDEGYVYALEIKT